MSAFDRRGVRVVVQTSEQAEFDFGTWRIPTSVQERIATNLKAMPVSPRDRYRGAIAIREIDGWDVMFIIVPPDEWVIMILSIEPAGTTESNLDYAMRVGRELLPPYVQELLKGRGRKDE